MDDLPRRWRRDLKPPPAPLWFKIWIAFCAVFGLAIMVFTAWAVVMVVRSHG